MHSRMSANVRAAGRPRAAASIDPSANGSAKSVCEKRMNVSVRLTGAAKVESGIEQLTASGTQMRIQRESLPETHHDAVGGHVVCL